MTLRRLAAWATILLASCGFPPAAETAKRNVRWEPETMAKTTGWIGGASGGLTAWEKRANWNNGQPEDADSVYIDPTAIYGPAVDVDRTLDNGTAATGTLTLTANAGNGETVTIDGKVYTFQTTLTDADGNVKIGASASASLDNLIDAINLGTGAGTDYATSMTLHQTVTALAGAGDTMDVTAIQKDASGNSIATTETLANGSWGNATLTGGANGTGLNLAVFDYPWNSNVLLGSSGTPMIFTADKMKLFGRGTAHFKTGTTTAARDTDRIITNVPASPTPTVYLSNDVRSRWLALEVASGNVDISFTKPTATAWVVNAMHVTGMGNTRVAAAFTGATTSTVSYLNVDSGYVRMNCFLEAIRVRGGTLWMDRNCNLDAAATHIVQSGGLVIYDVLLTDGASKYASSLALFAGTFDSTRTTGTKVVAVTTTFPDGVLLKSADFGSFTETIVGED